MAEHTPTSFWLTSLKAVAIFTLVSLGVAIILLAMQDWFGAGDIVSFAMWTLLFSLPLSAWVSLFAGWSTKWSPPIRYAAAGFVGLFTGYVLTLLLALMLGAWFAAFSFPVFYCWLFGSLLAFLLSISRPIWKGKIGMVQDCKELD
jgi:hypothetical protein